MRGNDVVLEMKIFKDVQKIRILCKRSRPSNTLVYCKNLALITAPLKILLGFYRVVLLIFCAADIDEFLLLLK